MAQNVEVCYHSENNFFSTSTSLFSMVRRSWYTITTLSLVIMFAAIAGTMRGGSLAAQVYNGPGLKEGAESAQVDGVKTGPTRVIIAGIVSTILSYVALAAVIVLIIAGLYLVLSFGEDSAKDKAKKIVIYTAIGIALILLAKVLVLFFISIVA